jgi:hypothetical protein
MLCPKGRVGKFSFIVTPKGGGMARMRAEKLLINCENQWLSGMVYLNLALRSDFAFIKHLFPAYDEWTFNSVID